MVLFNAAACLMMALLVTPAEQESAQSSPPSSPGKNQPEGAPVAQPQAQPASPRTDRHRRKRLARTSTRRRPALPAPEPPVEPRPSRTAGPTRQELTLMANVLGGYDDNLTAGSGTGAGLAPTAMASGSTGYLDATLDYFRGNTFRAIRMGSTGDLHAYPGYLEGPAAGGVITADARTTVGRTLTVRASERVGYEPFFSVFSPGAGSAPLPPAIGQTAPATGLFERRSLSSNSSVSADYGWSRRDSTSLAYSYTVQQFTDDDRGNNRSHDVLTEYRRRLARGVRARAAYQYVTREYIIDDGAVRPTREHRIEGGPEIAKALSRRRHLTLSLGAGASHVESINSVSREPFSNWIPIGDGRATLDLSPIWSVEGGYRRGFSLLQGVTDEVYTTDTASLSTVGLVTTRIDLRVGATYSNWRTALAPDVNDEFRVYGTSLQMRVALTETVAATAGYFYYQHRYSNPEALPAGFPAEYDRHAVRIGLTVWIPLVGTLSPRPFAPR